LNPDDLEAYWVENGLVNDAKLASNIPGFLYTNFLSDILKEIYDEIYGMGGF
jgi:hypothetical protein